MDSQLAQIILEVIGFGGDENKTKVLAAIVKSRTHSRDWVSFKDLYAQLLLEKGSTHVAEPLVYRALSDLEEEGYISVDRSGYRHGYQSNLSQITSALRTKIITTKKSIRDKIKHLSRDLEVINDLENSPPTQILLESVTEARLEERTEYVTGIDTVRSLIDEKIYARARKGDIVRISTSWTRSHWSQAEQRFSRLGLLARREAVIRVLTSKQWVVPGTTGEALKKYYEELKDVSTQIEVRRRTSEKAIYQMVARNVDEMVLIVSENPVSAIFIPRNANPMLIDSSVRAFDNEFSKGVNIIEEDLWREIEQ